MAEFKIRTKGNSDPQGKPRVYFTCHPEDFNRVFYNDRLSCFDRICADVFKTQDCAIYYTEDMRRPLDSENIDVDLGRANLFLVPVTLRLMNEPNRAMTVDIAYAKEHNIPILPFLMEVGIDSVYSLPRNFGQRQYITPYSADTSEISYDEKLKKKILNYIRTSYSTATLTEAAHMMGLSPSYLSRTVCNVFGQSFKDLLMAERFEAARELLRSTTMPIGDIINRVGYENSSYFHKEFRRRYGQTPGAYRKSYE